MNLESEILKSTLTRIYDDMTIEESVEELLDRIDYLDIDNEKKEEIINICDEIKNEKDDKTKEYLFKQLLNIVDM